jgi:MFS family permease
MARGAWLSRAVLVLALLAYAVPAALASGTDWGYWLLVGWIGWPVVGAIVVLRSPGNRIGWLMVAMSALFGVSSIGLLLGSQVPAALEASIWGLGLVAWTMIAAIVVLLPDGRPHSRLSRALLPFLLALAVLLVVLSTFGVPDLEESGRTNPLLVTALQPLADVVLADSGFAIVPLVMLGAVVDQIAAFRRSDGPVRAQYRWILFGVSVTVLTLVPGLVVGTPWWFAVFLNAIPISIGIAVLKYRLWDIDRIVSRTVAYGLVTAAVLGVYALGVTTFARLLPASDTLAVAVATLAAAAVFRPLLSRVQRYVDRRFDRARFDARREAEAFAARLTSAVDPDAVTTDLHAVLARTLAPGAVGVWTGSTR